MHTISSSAHERPRPSAYPLAALALIAVFLSGSATAAMATSTVDGDSGTALDSPDNTDGSLQDRYRHAPSFNNGGDYPDHFASAPNADMIGLLTAPLGNGDIVVAGLVPNVGASGTCSNGTSRCNIGLVRYNASGVRVPWPDPAGFGFNGNQYVVYPNDVSVGYQYLRDLKVVNGTIYLLQDGFNASQPGIGRQNVSIVSFFDNGRPRGSISVFGDAPADTEDFYGAQMVFLSGGRLIVTATDYDGTTSYLAAARLLVGANGGLNQDPTWGIAYPGSGNRIIRYPANVPYTVAYATNQIGFPVQDDFYVAGSVTSQGDSDVLVQKISGV
ncbi:MAG: hypothetical protein ABIR62_07490, partial [Dokdonella sp.]|uniref:hypothetical protein n=1 Tax=Dokdonella sp. TaxID=2291710 RepID=UPI00326405E5